jgi:type I restriction enzyme, S subunit
MNEQTIAGNISRNKRLSPRFVAWNPMCIAVGSIARNGRKEEVLASSHYRNPIFECRPGEPEERAKLRR